MYGTLRAHSVVWFTAEMAAPGAALPLPLPPMSAQCGPLLRGQPRARPLNPKP